MCCILRRVRIKIKQNVTKVLSQTDQLEQTFRIISQRLGSLHSAFRKEEYRYEVHLPHNTGTTGTRDTTQVRSAPTHNIGTRHCRHYRHCTGTKCTHPTTETVGVKGECIIGNHGEQGRGPVERVTRVLLTPSKKQVRAAKGDMLGPRRTPVECFLRLFDRHQDLQRDSPHFA